MNIPSDTRLRWPGEGPLFKSDSNKRWRAKMGPLLITPHLPFKISLSLNNENVCAGACDSVQRLICLLASRFKIKPNVKVFLL